MAKRNMSANSLANLQTDKYKFSKANPDSAQKAQKKSAEQRAENRKIENTIKSLANYIMDAPTSEEVQKGFAKIGLEVKTMLGNLMAQVVTKGMSSKATIKDKIALLEFLGKYTGQEPAQKLEIEDKPVINIDIPR